jgi:hypothetical protein
MIFLGDSEISTWSFQETVINRDRLAEYDMVVLWTAGRKKPVGLIPIECSGTSTVEGETCGFTLSSDDLFELLEQTAGVDEALL